MTVRLTYAVWAPIYLAYPPVLRGKFDIIFT